MIRTTLRSSLLAIALAVTVAACGSASSSQDSSTGTSRLAASGHRPTRSFDRLVEVDHGKLHLRCTFAAPEQGRSPC